MKRKKILILNSTNLSDNLIFDLLKDAKNYDIYLISYVSNFLDIKKIEQLVQKFNFNSFNIYEPRTKGIHEIEEYLKEIQEGSIILFIGLEKIFLNTSSNASQFRNGTKKFNYFSYDNIDSKDLISFIENLYDKFKMHFLFLLQSSIKVSERIVTDLESYAIEILSINYKNDNEDIQSMILNSLKSATYEESLLLLDKYKLQLTKTSIRSLQIMIWLNHGLKDKAIDFLKINYENLEDNEKKQLADFYYFDEFYSEAYTISYSLFKKNPFIIGLNALLLKTAIEVNKLEDIYEEVIAYSSDDIKALEICADYFSKDGTYTKAIEFRKRNFNISKETTQLLLIEMLKIKEDTPSNGNIAEQQILNVLIPYDNDEILYIEKSFRLGVMWFEKYKSPYKAYYHFKNVLKTCNNVHAVDAAKNRMMLLSNHGYSNKIIKYGYQKKYPDKLPTIRINELLNSLLILTHDDNGYIIWQNFIDYSQTIEVWKKYLAKRTIIELNKIDKDIKKEDVEKSSIFTKFKNNELIKMARLYKGEQLSHENILIIKEAAESFIAQVESIIEQIWIRYYIANFFIYIGEMQLANNHSISLWHLSNRIDDKNDSKIARLLGTLSWGIAQFKNGKEVEGISNILVTLKHFIDMKEVLPFIEDALGILNIWIYNNKKLFDNESLDFFIKFYKRLTPENAKQEEIYEFLANEDWEGIYNLLGYKIYNVEEYNSQWAIDFYYYVIATSKLKNITIDFDLLMNNLDNLVIALLPRKDQRAKLLYSLSELIFINSRNKYSAEERYKSSLKLLNISIKDLEDKRKNLKNIYERSFISDENKMIYELYLVVNIILFKTNSYQNKIEESELVQNIFDSFDYLSLRALKERKQNKSQMHISKELEEIEKEYLLLVEDMSQFTTKNFKNAYLSEEYKKKSERYGTLRKVLEKDHPYYRNDLSYRKIPMVVIQSNMMKDEVFYQYIDTKFFICYITITKDFIDFGFIENKHNYSEEKIELLANEIQNFTSQTKYNIEHKYLLKINVIISSKAS